MRLRSHVAHLRRRISENFRQTFKLNVPRQHYKQLRVNMVKPSDRRGGDHSSAEGPALPVAKAFVVQFAQDTDNDLTTCTGRVEHLVSGRRGRFRRLEELLAFVRDVLEREPGR